MFSNAFLVQNIFISFSGKNRSSLYILFYSIKKQHIDSMINFRDIMSQKCNILSFCIDVSVAMFNIC